jgi:hypothetical protein
MQHSSFVGRRSSVVGMAPQEVKIWLLVDAPVVTLTLPRWSAWR